MSEVSSNEIRERFLKFFEKRGHKIIPSASLVPDLQDSSVLFTTAGMQPLVPYLLGQEHPQGKRLANIQKCVRTNDIDEVGDNTHLTFFEMLGNWSLGDYWKEESINWSYELLTSKEDGFGLDPQRLYVTCFEGDSNAPKDEESAEIWRKIFQKNGVTGERIYFRPKEKNWWPQPKESDDYSGPCGPDTEMFYDLTGELNRGMTLEEYLKADDEQKVVEIWNNVFMQYLKKEGKVVGELENKNVDTGAGFERIVTVVQGKSSVFDTDLFQPIITEIITNLPNSDIKSQRVISDHLRASMFLLSEGVEPSNKDRGYILRRLIRRAVAYTFRVDKKFDSKKFELIAKVIAKNYKNYPELDDEVIYTRLKNEVRRFRKTFEEGLKKFETTIRFASGEYIPGMNISTKPVKTLFANDVFDLITTYGFQREDIKEMAGEKEIVIDWEEVDIQLKKHQEVSRAGSEQKFKGGLSGTGLMETKYHTCAHLLHQALRDTLNHELLCKGSNITPERLRFDFPFERKLTDEDKKKIEDIVNQKISENLPVNKVVMKKDEALQTGALHVFDQRYPDEVNVYYIGESLDKAYSKEFCGGPHVENTGELAGVRDPEGNPRHANFKIIKEEAVSADVRRIKAVLE